MDFLREPTGIVIHHSATRDTASLSFDAIRRWHTEELGWDDVGYHFVLEDFDGVPILLTGRALQYYGAHTLGHNSTIGICVVGDFDENCPDMDVLYRLTDLLRGLLTIYPDLTPEDIHFHADFASKSSPGKRFPSLKQIRARVERGR